jgi:hypothetical protein
VTSEAAIPDDVNETVGGRSGRGGSRAACVAAGRPGGAGQGRAIWKPCLVVARVS